MNKRLTPVDADHATFAESCILKHLKKDKKQIFRYDDICKKKNKNKKNFKMGQRAEQCNVMRSN